ncbi:MAG TPA: hypothetical protein VIL23_03565 [Clostridia bacterium]
MEIVNLKLKSHCEIGVCKNLAEYAVRAKKLGVRNEIHICKECLAELNKLSSKILKQRGRDEQSR